MLTLLCFMLVSFLGFSNPHVTMSLRNISSTPNSAEFDLYIVNDGSTSLKLSACSFGVNFDAAILNGGTVTYSYIEESRDNDLNGLTSYSVKHTVTSELQQLRMTTTQIKVDNAPELIHNIPYKLGRFKMINSSDWLKNSNPLFSLQEFQKLGLTTTQIIGFVGDEKKLVALTPSLKRVTLEVEKSGLLNATQSNNSQNVVLGSQLLLDELSISVYPNPVEAILKFDFVAHNTGKAIIYISDLSGRVAKKIETNFNDGLNSNSIDLTSLAAGAYCLKLSDANNINYSKIFSKN